MRRSLLRSLPPELSPDQFLSSLGIEQRVVELGDEVWVLTGNIIARIRRNKEGIEVLPVDDVVLRRFEKEQRQRLEILRIIRDLEQRDPVLSGVPVMLEWRRISQPLPARWVRPHSELIVRKQARESGLVLISVGNW